MLIQFLCDDHNFIGVGVVPWPPWSELEVFTQIRFMTPVFYDGFHDGVVICF